MTLGIGVLCCSMPPPHVPRPDAIVLLGDTIGSTETESVEDLHEMYIDPHSKLFGVCVGHMEKAGSLFQFIQTEFHQLQHRNGRTCAEALNNFPIRLEQVGLR